MALIRPPNQPDLTARYKIKEKYARLQSKYTRAQEINKDLLLEVEEKELKVQRLQDEVEYAHALHLPVRPLIFVLYSHPASLVIDQIYDSDYAHLLPLDLDYFSDDDNDEHGVKGNGKKAVRRGDDEDEGGVGAEEGQGNGNHGARGAGEAVPTNGGAAHTNGSSNGAGPAASNGRTRKASTEVDESDLRLPKRAKVEGVETATGGGGSAGAPVPAP